MPVQTRIQLRHDTAANWTSTNPVLAVGEAGVETDTKLVKHGDGATAWVSLAYQNTGVPTGGTAGQLLAKSSSTDFATQWTNDLSAVNSIGFDTTPTGVPTATGTLSWNTVDNTLDLQAPGITYQLGQELAQNVKRFDSSGLTNGKVVYVVGSDGANMLVDYSIATSDTTSAKTLGVMTDDASGGSKAPCTTFGLVRNIDTSTLTEGATVWLSSTVAGGMTTTKPVAPAHTVQIGYCTRSHATQGSIFVTVQNGYEVDELHDVLIGTKVDGQVITYEASSGLWKNKTPVDPTITSINAQTGTTYTVALTDHNRMVELNNAAAISVTVPTNATTAFPVGATITLLQTGAGQVTVSGAGGVTLDKTPGNKLRTQWSSATLIKRATDSWVLIGDLAI
jgi:hypothetical protein